MTIKTLTYVEPLKVFVVMNTETFDEKIQAIFLNKDDAIDHWKESSNARIEEHEIIL